MEDFSEALLFGAYLADVDFHGTNLTNANLQTANLGRLKLDSAKDTIRDINPNVEVVGYGERLTSANALEIFKDYDVIADGTDNFPTRYLVNDACVLLGKPNAYGSIFRFEGQISVFDASRGPCYRCLYPEPPPPGLVPSCAEGGVLGVLPGIVGCFQALETIKLILGNGSPLIGRLLLFDALQMKFRELKLRKNPECPICGTNPTIKELIDYEEFCGIRGEEAVSQITVPEVTATEVKKMMDEKKPFVLIDVREPHEYQICKIPGSKLIPLGEVARRMHELNSADEIVVHCRSGQRSAEAVEFLMKAGFSKIHNLKGGVLAWSDEVDPTMPKY